MRYTPLLERYAPIVLRYALSAVILWFSLQQFLHNSVWTAYIPAYAVALTHLSAPALVFFNASFELIFGMMLVFGWQTRISALLLGLHLLDIMWTVGYGEIGVRDFGLAIALLVIAMNGPDWLCLDRRRKKPDARTPGDMSGRMGAPHYE
ncbi:MAG: DoxX family membrane protein [Patescibacteria group bacterium]|nr:DoxX family membrane protein [Patescibacteria group bacterium]MDE1941126.1 DoxX family membrane protein [Patescibacteria group bacterium]MDE1966483.1 DoxX family membrane protein [Patescibacteria group bacterium]